MKQINKPIHFNLKTPESWFLNLLNQMEQKTKLEYPDSILFHINGKVYMEYKVYLEYKVIDYDLYYSYQEIHIVLQDSFNLNRNQIDKLIKVIVGNHTNLKIDTTMIRSQKTFDYWRKI